MNYTKGFFANAARDTFTGILIAVLLALIAGATVASAQDKSPEPEIVIDLGEQFISAVDDSAIADSVAIIETKIRMNRLREEIAMISDAREKYAARLAEINRAIVRRRDEE